MSTRRILVVEDDPILAMELEDIIHDGTPADVVTTRTAADAERELRRPCFNFAFLDVNLADGKSYQVADMLLDYGVPFVFVSANPRDLDMPGNLRHVPLLSKPYRPGLCVALVNEHAA